MTKKETAERIFQTVLDGNGYKEYTVRKIIEVLDEYAPDKIDVIAEIRTAQGSQTQANFAESLNVSTTYLSDIYNGHRPPGPKILKALNLVKETSFKRWR